MHAHTPARFRARQHAGDQPARGSAAFVGSSTSSTNSTISILIGIDLKIRGPFRQAAMGSTLSSSASNVLSTALTVHLALARRPRAPGLESRPKSAHKHDPDRIRFEF